ncbi:hypothetical protein F4809DRAFT_646930 [Biscogniauxia mediterranea]|nr:hypothetical protein F4809DRAFT_646930 [Biscogniauxia mediterranea]
MQLRVRDSGTGVIYLRDKMQKDPKMRGARLAAADDDEQHIKQHPSGVTGLAGGEMLFGREPIDDVVDEGKQIDIWEWPIGAPGKADHCSVQRLIRFASPRDTARNIEVGVDLLKEGGEAVRLELDGEKSSFGMRLGPRPPLVNYQQNYHWEWMR